MTRRGLLLGAAGIVACARRGSPLERACEYLWRRQSEDGGWHSTTYGLLRSGQSLTPFVLNALSAALNENPSGTDRAAAFIRKHVTMEGALGMADPDVPDYPNYATALAVSSLVRSQRERDLVPRMVAWLRGQQFTEQNGWKPEDPAYGAWGMGGDRRTPPDTGHVDLSMTRCVLDALRAAGADADDRAVAAARTFVERCQNFDPANPNDADGGFFFSTTEHDTNKAGHDGQKFRSYGTTTADGILALLATGSGANDVRLAAAKRWLEKHHKGIDVPGFVGEAYKRWPKGLAFYYAGVGTLAFQALKLGAPAGVREALTREQKDDGSWANPENLVKEDDPLIATPFGVIAFSGSKPE